MICHHRACLGGANDGKRGVFAALFLLSFAQSLHCRKDSGGGKLRWADWSLICHHRACLGGSADVAHKTCFQSLICHHRACLGGANDSKRGVFAALFLPSFAQSLHCRKDSGGKRPFPDGIMLDPVRKALMGGFELDMPPPSLSRWSK